MRQIEVIGTETGHLYFRGFYELQPHQVGARIVAALAEAEDRAHWRGTHGVNVTFSDAKSIEVKDTSTAALVMAFECGYRSREKGCINLEAEREYFLQKILRR